MASPKRNRRGKRHDGWQQQQEQPEVDDLAVAASFAQIPTLPLKPSNEKKESPVHDDDDDEASSTSTCSSCSCSDKQEEDDKNESDNDDDVVVERDTNHSADADDSDDESDVDLSEALARMQDDEEPNNKNKNESSQAAPTTEHELDPYRTPISDLETKFQLNLTVAEQERLRLDKETAVAANSGPVELCAAGHVKCHMAEDRTIVVESAAMGNTSAPLDEGSLLVIRIQNEQDEKSQLVPLGKVFEVFGPVSRPLYTVRLPLQKEKPAKQKQPDRKDEPKVDSDEISLNDDDDSKEQEECKDGETPVEADQSAPSNTETDSPSKAEDDAQTNDDSVSVDPWAPQGKHTKLLQSTKGMPVYYIPDIAKLLDTGAIIRNSGRGCDASNLYDEEVINANDMAFSDDEQEREFKNRNKRGKKGKRRNNGGKSSSEGNGRARAAQNGSGYTGFHAPQHVMHPSNPPAQYGMPHPNHPFQYQPGPGSYPYQHQQPYSHPQQFTMYPHSGAPGYAAYPQGTVPPPPPPPPPYPYETHPNAQSQAPGGGPPPEESSDTVYYD